MPNRELREGLLTSETVMLLTAEEERLLTRLFLCADDFGRFDARPVIVKSRAFPMADLATDLMTSCTLTAIESWLSALHAKGAIQLYEVDGKPFLRILRWKQRRRANASKYPDPTDRCPAFAGPMPGGCPTDDGHMSDMRPASAPEERGSRNEDRGTRIEERGGARGGAAGTAPSAAGGTVAGEACRLMRQAGCSRVNPSDAELLQLLSQGVTARQLGDLATELHEAKGNVSQRYVVRTFLGRLSDAARAPPQRRFSAQSRANTQAATIAALTGRSNPPTTTDTSDEDSIEEPARRMG